jgi:hypothetical protein
MKPRVVMMIFASILLMGTLAGAAEGRFASALMVTEESALTPAAGTLPCSKSGSPLERAIFSSSTESDPTYCGSCSHPVCNGASRGMQCVRTPTSPLSGFCHPYNLTDICSADGQWRCDCLIHDLS